MEISNETISLIESLKIIDKKKIGIRYNFNFIIPKNNFIKSSSSTLEKTDIYDEIKSELIKKYGREKLNDLIDKEMTRRFRIKYPRCPCRCKKMFNYISDNNYICNICDKEINNNDKFFGCFLCNIIICIKCF